MGWKFWGQKKSEAQLTLERLQAESAVGSSVSFAKPATGADTGFRMTVEDVFSITGRGTVVTGRVEAGTVTVNQDITIQPVAGGTALQTTVTGIEAFRKMLDTATAGDNVGLLIRGIKRDDVRRGDTLIG